MCPPEELEKARQEIEEMNAKCSDLVKTTEANASAQLSQERDSHNRTLAELQKQLADKVVELEELAKKQRATVVHVATEERSHRERELLVERSSEVHDINKPINQDEQ